MNTRPIFAVLACGAAAACAGGDKSPDAPAAAGELTFWQDVAPIVSEKCAGCHQSGGIAPFSLESFQDVQSRAGIIADVTVNRAMPPYHMETGGTCGSFDESVALSEHEITTIGAWARGDRTEGTPMPIAPRPRPRLDPGSDFQTPRFIPEISGGVYAEEDEYRCFMLDHGLSADTFVTGYEVLPGNPALVHHVIGMFVDPNGAAELPGQTNGALMQALDADSPDRDGWPCFGLAGEGVALEAVPLVWAPGQGVVEYPGAAGVRLRRDQQLVIQVHYNLDNPELHGQADQTTVRLRFSDTVERQALFAMEDELLDTLLEGTPTPLEPGRPSVVYTWKQTADALGVPPDSPMQLLGLMPHMHQRGRKLRFELGENDAFKCQGQVNDWNFHWQRMYMYRKPPTLNADTQLRVTCEYDTSNDTEPVLPGWGSRNEMCGVIMILAYPPGVFL